MSRVTRLVQAFIAVFFSHSCLAADISEASLRAADAEQMRIIVEGDAKAQDAFMHPNYILNAPANRQASVVESPCK